MAQGDPGLQDAQKRLHAGAERGGGGWVGALGKEEVKG